MPKMVYEAWFTCRVCGKTISGAQTVQELPPAKLEDLRFTIRCPHCFFTDHHYWFQATKKKSRSAS